MSQDARETARARSADVLTLDDAKIHALPAQALIVVRVPSEDEQEEVFASLATRLLMLSRSDVTVIAINPGAELDVLDADQMRAAGWVRA